MIEKHFTLRRADGGVDSAFSMEPEEMAQLVIETERAWQTMGRIEYGPLEAERKSIQFRRSLYIVQDVPPGGTLTTENVRSIRPGFDLPVKYLDAVLGQQVRHGARRGMPVTWDLIKCSE